MKILRIQARQQLISGNCGIFSNFKLLGVFKIQNIPEITQFILEGSRYLVKYMLCIDSRYCVLCPFIFVLRIVYQMRQDG